MVCSYNTYFTSNKEPLLTDQRPSQRSNPRLFLQSLSGRRLDRRSAVALAAGGFAALGAGRAGAQESPPIVPIGPESTLEPIEIQPDSELPPAEADAIGGQVDAAPAGEGELYFAQTGHNLGVPFLTTWQTLGGLDVFGAPLSELRYMADVNESHQTFETLTLRYDPDLAYENRIQGLALDDRMLREVIPSGARPAAGATPEVSGEIRAWWESHGGVNIIGNPVSEAFTRNGTTTQVFANAIIEQGADGKIGLRRIGRQWIVDNGLEEDEAFVPAPPNLGETALVQAEGGLRLRNGPGTDSDVIVVLPDNASFMAVAGAEGDWIPGYVDGYSGWVAAEFLVEPGSVVQESAVGTSDWRLDVWQGIALGVTNVRAEPTTASATIRELYSGEPIVVVDWVRGEEVVENSWIWAQLEGGGYVFARNVGRSAPVAAPPITDDMPWEGKWIDVHLTQQLMVAYDGRTPVRVAVVTTGMPGWETPPGWFSINWRVENETMTSGAIGAEYFYKLENVLYTQYFTNRGHALHYAWWRTPETIGRPGSHGCINMLMDDSLFFWNWATIGTPVIVRTV